MLIRSLGRLCCAIFAALLLSIVLGVSQPAHAQQPYCPNGIVSGDGPTTAPDLMIGKTHSGNFFQGQTGATYMITVTNIGNGPTSGTVTVTDTLPVGLTPTAAGDPPANNWNCTIVGQTVTCTNSSVLPANSSYPALTVTVDVANDAPPTVTNCATVSGVGDVNPCNDTACDLTSIFQGIDVFQVNYFAGANGARPDQTVRITNPGTASGVAAVAVTYDLCANIYVFRNDQQLAECCSCKVTPNGLRTLSVDFDLTRNPLTPGAIGEGVIKIVSSPVTIYANGATGCTPATAASGYTPVAALRAWGTHNQDVSGGLQGSAINQVTETHFLDATLSPAELKELQTNCAFINSQGSGHGICSCGRGD